jgi:hypothetical protein
MFEPVGYADSRTIYLAMSSFKDISMIQNAAPRQTGRKNESAGF